MAGTEYIMVWKHLVHTRKPRSVWNIQMSKVVEEPFLKWRGTSARHKNYGKFLSFELATSTSAALKYDVINFCQHV